MQQELEREEQPKCVICGNWCEPWPGGYGWGNNPEPVSLTGRACNSCNNNTVIPARLAGLRDRPAR